MYYIIFIVVSIVLVLLVFLFYNKKMFSSGTLCTYNHLILNTEQLSVLGELLDHFIRVSNKHNIKYFAIGGTLIGAMRNGGFMPIDDDIDIGILESEQDKIRLLNSDLFYIKETYFGYKLFKKNSDIFIDIMVFELKDSMYQIRNDAFPNESMYLDEVYPLQQVPFSGRSIHVPYKSKEYLDRVFESWDTKMVMNCDHHKKDDEQCFYDRLSIPEEIPLQYDDSKYLCYINL